MRVVQKVPVKSSSPWSKDKRSEKSVEVEAPYCSAVYSFRDERSRKRTPSLRRKQKVNWNEHFRDYTQSCHIVYTSENQELASLEQ